jgi:O-antigen ligase
MVSARAFAREFAAPLVLGASLVALMSPLSRQGHIGESTAVAWALLLLVVIAARRSARPSRAEFPEGLWAPEAVLLVIVCLYVVLGLARSYPLRLVAWESAPYFEFAAWAVAARLALRTKREIEIVLVLVIAGATAKSLGDLGIFFVELRRTGGTGLQDALASRIIDAPPFLLAPIALFLAVGGGLVPHVRRLCWVATAIILVVLAASLTRSYWLGLLIGIVVAAAAKRGPAATRLLIGTLGLLVLVALVTFAAPRPLSTPFRLVEHRLVSYTSHQLHAKDETLATRRQDELRGAWRAISADRLLGRGIGGSIPRTFAPLEATEGYRVAFLHNYFVQVLLKLGIVGFAAFGWIVVALLRQFRVLATVPDPFASSVAAGVLAMWVMESAQLLLYPKTSIFHIPAYMGFSVALVLGAHAATRAPTAHPLAHTEGPITSGATADLSSAR